MKLVLHLEKLNNIDIFRRGYYCIQVRVQAADDKKTRINCKIAETRDKMGSNTFSEGEHLFRTKIFSIVYELQEIELDEYVSFMIPTESIYNFSIQIDLCFKTGIETDMKVVQTDIQNISNCSTLTTRAYIVANFGGEFHSNIGAVYWFDGQEGIRLNSSQSLATAKQLRHSWSWDSYRDWLSNKHIFFLPKNLLESLDAMRVFTLFNVKSKIPFLVIQRHYSCDTDSDLDGINVSMNGAPISPGADKLLDYLENADPDIDLHHILSRKAKSVQNIGTHLIVFVHGLAGASQDFRRYRNFLLHSQLNSDKQICLLAASNENSYSCGIEEMGERLANEVSDFIIKHDNRHSEKIKWISFICHSLGGLVVRHSISHASLACHKSKFHSYISLATPHLGLRYWYALYNFPFVIKLHQLIICSRNTFVKGALWAASWWKGAKCLSQLTLDDDPDIEKSFLFSLSKTEGMHFSCS